MIEESARFFCDCGVPGHAIDLTPDDTATEKILRVTLWHDPISFADRIKTAARALFGRANYFDEVYLRGESLQAFIAYVSKLRQPTSVTVTTTHGVTYTFKDSQWRVQP